MRHPLRAAVVAAMLCAGLLAGCAGGGPQASSQAASDLSSGGQPDSVEVVCATFPAYDWVMQVAGQRADALDITYLTKSGVDMHSFQPAVNDIAKINDADLFVYVGGVTDGWATDAVNAAGNTGLHALSMLEVVGDAAVTEETVAGMQDDGHSAGAESDESHNEDNDYTGETHDADSFQSSEAASSASSAADQDGSGHEASDRDHEGAELDEHVWLSLRNAQILVDAIARELSEIDPEGASAYAANAESYKAELAALDARFADAVAAAPKDTLVFADRFPFRYLVDDYGIGYFAAFPGCSAETEASFETVAFLAQKIDELGLGGVLVIENSDHRIAETVIASTQDKDQRILVMDSLQSASDADIASGKSYLSAMEANLATLGMALTID